LTDASLVVFHSAVIACVPAAEREHFVATARGLPGHWVLSKRPGLLPGTDLPGARESVGFVGALDAEPVAFAAPHGHSRA
jgi:hypothetical protein